jgi:hypothetical protein
VTSHPILAALRALTQRGRLSFAVLGILAAVVTGPFETHLTLSLPMQMLYWSVVVPGSICVAALVLETLGLRLRAWPGWHQTLAEALAMGLVFAPLVHGWTWLMVTPPDGQLMGFHWFLLDVVLISFAIFAGRRIIIDRIRMAAFERPESGAMALPGATGATGAAGAPMPVPVPVPVPVRPRLMRRIAADDPGPILRIEARGHFVHVVTARQSHVLRLRFADAVDQMDGVEGVIAHRSHWVARAAIAGVRRAQGRVALRMTCGADVPVSRKQLPLLEAAGVICAAQGAAQGAELGAEPGAEPGVLPDADPAPADPSGGERVNAASAGPAPDGR